MGHLDGAVVWSTQDCFVTVAHENSLAVCGAMLPCHHSHRFFPVLPAPAFSASPRRRLIHFAHSSCGNPSQVQTHTTSLSHTHTLPIPYPRGKLQLAWRSSHSSWLIDLRFLSSRCDGLRLLRDRQGDQSHTRTFVLLYTCEDFLLISFNLESRN